jgi:acetyl esterase/lipase
LPALRRVMAEQMVAMRPLEPLPVSLEIFTVPGPEAGQEIRVLAYRPENASGPLPAIFHIHGGGYVLGTPEMMDAVNRDLAVDLGCAIFSVDYRLAPETPFPGAIEDCYAGLQWVVSHAAQLRIDPSRIGVKGESAGGGLAAALALLVRDRKEISLAFQHLIYPMIDDRTCVAVDPHPFTGAYIWTPEGNRFGWSALLGTAPGSAEVSPYAAAARAEDLAGLPPSFISVGALDLFFEENMDYARRLARAGVAVELHVYPGAFHGFEMAQAARVSVAALLNSREALRRALHG